jgi:hypothetical protein
MIAAFYIIVNLTNCFVNIFQYSRIGLFIFWWVDEGFRSLTSDALIPTPIVEVSFQTPTHDWRFHQTKYNWKVADIDEKPPITQSSNFLKWIQCLITFSISYFTDSSTRIIQKFNVSRSVCISCDIAIDS